MTTINRKALIETILTRLPPLPNRQLTPHDVRFSHRPGQQPNWSVAVLGAKLTELEDVRRDLSDYDLDANGFG